MFTRDITYPSMKKITSFLCPSKIVFGAGSRAGLVNEMRSLGGSRGLIVTDPHIESSQNFQELVSGLRSGGVRFEVFSKAEPEPPIEVAENLAAFTRAGKFDLIVGVGGGSVMDLAKVAALSVSNLGRISSYFGVDLVTKKGAPLICMPTTSGTGSEVSPYSVVVVGEKKRFLGGRNVFADAVLVDPVLAATMPPNVTAGTGLDALSHAIECVTSLDATPLTDALSLTAIQLVARWLRIAYHEGSNLEARGGMAMAATNAGLAIGNGRTTLGHSMSQTFGPMKKIPHGIACGIALPYTMEFYLSVIPEKLALVAEAMGVRNEKPVKEKAREGIQIVKKLAEDLGIKLSLREAGVDRSELPKLAEMSMNDFPRPNSPRAFTKESVQEVFEDMWEGKILG